MSSIASLARAESDPSAGDVGTPSAKVDAGFGKAGTSGRRHRLEVGFHTDELSFLLVPAVVVDAERTAEDWQELGAGTESLVSDVAAPDAGHGR